MDITEDRHNQVLIGGELSDTYYVQDGIDQGEVWSPLLWRIFYEPLLIKLEEIRTKVGYKLTINDVKRHMSEDRQIDNQEKYYYNVLAFMDDTTVISRNKEGKDEMLSICNSFYNMCDIKANVK